MHARGRDRSLEERHARHLNSSDDEALSGSGASLLSHTPTPIGNLVKVVIKGWGDADNKGEAADSPHHEYVLS